MHLPENLKYTDSHEWVAFMPGHTAKIGLTDYAQKALGSLVFISLPEPGDPLAAGESFGEVESVKAVSDIISPFTAAVVAVNEALLDDPGAINKDPYESWLVEAGGITAQYALLDADEYRSLCEEG
jgi:glycine cleavage system H protein